MNLVGFGFFECFDAHRFGETGDSLSMIEERCLGCCRRAGFGSFVIEAHGAKYGSASIISAIANISPASKLCRNDIVTPGDNIQAHAPRDNTDPADLAGARRGQRAFGFVRDNVFRIDQMSGLGPVGDHLVEGFRQPDVTAAGLPASQRQAATRCRALLLRTL